jgi:hypothetical protein
MFVVEYMILRKKIKIKIFNFSKNVLYYYVKFVLKVCKKMLFLKNQEIILILFYLKVVQKHYL